MEFVHPERLWLLFLVLIPILIHLFHFRKRKTLFFSSLRFIQFLEKQEQSARKLKHFLILATRIMALSALVFAFANPYIPETSAHKSGKMRSSFTLTIHFRCPHSGQKEASYPRAENWPNVYSLRSNQIPVS